MAIASKPNIKLKVENLRLLERIKELEQKHEKDTNEMKKIH